MQIDLDAVAALALAGDDRNDGDVLHASDIGGGCDYAIWTRLRGDAQLPNDDEGAFFLGHAVENELEPYLAAIAWRDRLHVRKGGTLERDGILGHMDYSLYAGEECVAVIDPRTTKATVPSPNDGHVLKTAWYARELGAPDFAEWVFCLGYGKIIAHKAFWFRTEDYLAHLAEREAYVRALAARTVAPPQEPPPGQEWRCQQRAKGKLIEGKSYCNATTCPRNAALSEAQRAALDVLAL